MNTDNKIIIDWFSVTFRDYIMSVDDVIKLVNIDCDYVLISGHNGFSHCLTYNNIRIEFDNSMYPDMLMLSLSGQGCRAFETYSNYEDCWLELFKFVSSNLHFCKVTRLDLAFDDFTGLLDLPKIVDDTRQKNYISKFKFKPVYHTTVYGVNDYGYTVDMGNRSGEVFIRIYDKARERNKEDLIPHWVRFEIQFRCPNWTKKLNKPQVLVQQFASGSSLDVLFFSCANKYIRFVKNSDSDSNKWRSDLADHWVDFYNYIDTVDITLYSKPGVEYNEKKLKETYGKHYAGGIYTYISLFGVDQLVADVKKNSENSLNPQYKSLLDKRKLDNYNKNELLKSSFSFFEEYYNNDK